VPEAEVQEFCGDGLLLGYSVEKLFLVALKSPLQKR
jgi:hypothetical protein